MLALQYVKAAKMWTGKPDVIPNLVSKCCDHNLKLQSVATLKLL